MIHKLQLVHMPSIKEVKSFSLMFHLKLSSEGRCRSLEDSLDQRYGPRFLFNESNALLMSVDKTAMHSMLSIAFLQSSVTRTRLVSQLCVFLQADNL